jgi:CheY-like chemotaxis protein
MENARSETTTSDPTVLVVEDERPVLESHELKLGSEGYNVRTAENGGEALVELGTDVDVVLLDRRMPGMSGDEVLEHIEDWDMDCRVVMVTAIDPDETVAELGFDDYLTKPVSKDKLAETIEQLLLFDQYERLLTEYHNVTKTYATLKANHDGGQTEILEQIDEERAQIRQQLEATIDSFADDVITEIFADIHGIEC